MKIIAYIYTDFPEKFGIPRQSGLVPELQGRIVFEPEYRNTDALRGIEGYDYLWLLWQFEGVDPEEWRPTVRPPRLGGNKRVGVFATRSPFRPNAIGLSSVKLEHMEMSQEGPVLWVSGIDMRNRTPIYDIKPYLPYVDSHPDARGGFAHEKKDERLRVIYDQDLMQKIPLKKRQALIRLLEQDPRPHYQEDASRIYGMCYDTYEVKFQVDGDLLKIVDIESAPI